jgi:WD40 repeat protein
MLGRSFDLRNLQPDDDVGVSRMSGRDTGFRVSLPSPFLLAIAVVFVILPLVWPENADETSAPKALDTFELSYDVKCLDISPDGQSVAATCRDRPIGVWVRGEPDWRHILLPKHQLNGSRCPAFSPKGTILAAGNVDGTITLWDVASGQQQASLDAGTETVSAVAFSPDGAMLASAAADSRVLLWDVAERRLRAAWEGHSGPVTALAFSPDGRRVASGGEDHTVRLWDVEQQHTSVVLRGHSDIVLAVAFSPAGRLLASSSLSDHRIRFWDITTGESRASLYRDASDAATITCLAFAPRDGYTLVAGNEHGIVSIWSLATRREKAPLYAHKGWVKSLAFSSDQRLLVAPH